MHCIVRISFQALLGGFDSTTKQTLSFRIPTWVARTSKPSSTFGDKVLMIPFCFVEPSHRFNVHVNRPSLGWCLDAINHALSNLFLFFVKTENRWPVLHLVLRVRVYHSRPLEGSAFSKRVSCVIHTWSWHVRIGMALIPRWGRPHSSILSGQTQSRRSLCDPSSLHSRDFSPFLRCTLPWWKQNSH